MLAVQATGLCLIVMNDHCAVSAFLFHITVTSIFTIEVYHKAVCDNFSECPSASSFLGILDVDLDW